MGRPKPCVLFAQSFLHPTLAEYVDEVRFTEPVVVCACEFLELHAPSVCPTLSLSGVSFPQSFALEIFVRIGGEARFKRLCPAFLYSPSASSVLEVQAAVTDHLVIRGSYRTLSFIVYGNSVKELGQFNFDHEIDNTLSDAILPPEAVFKPEDLPEALQDDAGCTNRVITPLKNLRLVCDDTEQSKVMHHLLSLAIQVTKSGVNHLMYRKIFDILLSAASAVLSQHGSESRVPQWHLFMKNYDSSERKLKNSLKQAYQKMKFFQTHLLNSSLNDESDQDRVDVILKTVFGWLQRSFWTSSSSESDLALEEYLMGGLAAVQLICIDAEWCFHFIAAGGFHYLINLLQHSTSPSAVLLLILGALKCACRHAFACEALLGWSPANMTPVEKQTVSIGYRSVLKLMLQTKQQNVCQLASEVLRHLHGYQHASEFQSTVESLLEDSNDKNGLSLSEDVFEKLSSSLKGLKGSLVKSNHAQDSSPVEMAHLFSIDGDDNTSSVPPTTIFNWISDSKYSFTEEDLNKYILIVLQERQFIPSLAALLSSPWMRDASDRFRDTFLEFIGNIQSLILIFVNSRSGLLFLGSDHEASAALISSLCGVESIKEISLDLRHASSLISAGYTCKMQDIGCILSTSLSVIGVIDRLLATPHQSESFLWLLWELSVFSRSECGRQALSMVVYFPEAILLLFEVLHSESNSDEKEARALNRAVVHSAAEVMQVILKDLFTSSLAGWVPHALSLQKALQYCSPTTIDIAVSSHGLGTGNKDGLCARLLDWVDAAVIFHKKGIVGLLRYAAALVVGSVTSVAVGGLPSGDPVEIENTIGESAVNTELPTVNTLLGRGVMLGASGTVLPDTALIQLTVAMRIMSFLSCHSGVAAILYGEGAMSIVYILLEYGAGILQTSSIDYDYMVEEEGEDDGITEMALEQEREQSLLGLLLPTLLLLLCMLKRLQLTGEEYRNTRLVDVLLQLHRCVCFRLASKLSQGSGMLLLASVSRVLASTLAFWPVLGWAPSLVPKLLGLESSSLIQSSFFPLEPKDAISIFWVLGDMLPEECPRLCANEILTMDISRSLAVGTLLGTRCMKFVDWHCQNPECNKLVQAIELHLETLATMFCSLSSTVSTLLQALLVKFAVRMACQSQDSASILMRPLVALLRDDVMVGSHEYDAFRVEQVLLLIKELVMHPATKQVLMKEGIVQVLLQTGSGKIGMEKIEVTTSTNKTMTSMRLLCLIMDIFVAICDLNVSACPEQSSIWRFTRDCPGFLEYCAIISWTYNNMLSLPFGKELDVMVESLRKILGHQLGRAACAFFALSLKKATSQSSFDEVPSKALEADISMEFQIPEGMGSFVAFCKRVATALCENVDISSILSVLQNFCLAVIQLSAAGRSACGLGALRLLFEMDKIESREMISTIIDTLQGTNETSINTTKYDCSKALKCLAVLLRLLNNLPATIFLEDKVKAIVSRLNVQESLADDYSSLKQTFPYWTAFPQLSCESECDVEAIWDTGSINKFDAIFEDILKEKFSWECSDELSDKVAASGVAMKRKLSGAHDGGNKKLNIDGVTSSAADGTPNGNGNPTGRVSGTLLSNSASTRRDPFRQRKPNTSRPPSMHVDDYVARERGTEMGVSGSVSVNLRGAVGGGRPPSIHVDEFMARQRERHVLVGAVPPGNENQTLISPPVQPSSADAIKVESAASSVRVKPILSDDLQDVDIELEGMPDTDDPLSSLPVGVELFVPNEDSITASTGKVEVHLSTTTLTVYNDRSKHISTGDPVKATKLEGIESIPIRSFPSDKPSSVFNLNLQVSQVTEMGVPLQRLEGQVLTSFNSHVLHNRDHGSGVSHETVGIPPQRGHLQFPLAPAPAPPLPPPPPIPVGVVPEKYDNTSGGYRRDGSAAPPPPPAPPRPSGPWPPPDLSMGRIDQVHVNAMNQASYGSVPPVNHGSNPQYNSSSIFPHAPLSPWPVANEEVGTSGTGRLAPPLPPTPPPFASSQTSVVQAPVTNAAIHSPSPYHNVGRNPVEATPSYSFSSGMDEKRFGTFSPPAIGQTGVPQPAVLPANFQPPLPPGRPNLPQGSNMPGSVGQQLQHFNHPQLSQQTLASKFPSQTQVGSQSQQFQQSQQTPSQVIPSPQLQGSQQESGNLLQQILASPEAIQDLLKDQTKLQNLLEQHPKLISLLQEKMGQG